MKKESIDYDQNQSQEIKREEQTIYSQKINYNDSLIMNRFHNEEWDKNGVSPRNLKIKDFGFLLQGIFIEIFQRNYQKRSLIFCTKKFQKDSVL